MCALKRRIHRRGKRELHIEEVCCILKREQQQGLPHKKKERAAKREPLREKEDSQERESYVWRKNRKESAKCCLL